MLNQKWLLNFGLGITGKNRAKNLNCFAELSILSTGIKAASTRDPDFFYPCRQEDYLRSAFSAISPGLLLNRRIVSFL